MKHQIPLSEVRSRVRLHIGKTFPYESRNIYPHGLMQTARLLDVTDGEFHDQVEIEVTFTDGYKANYCTALRPFFEKTILNN